MGWVPLTAVAVHALHEQRLRAGEPSATMTAPLGARFRDPLRAMALRGTVGRRDEPERWPRTCPTTRNKGDIA